MYVTLFGPRGQRAGRGVFSHAVRMPGGGLTECVRPLPSHVLTTDLEKKARPKEQGSMVLFIAHKGFV